jgi:MYXO-CTERM domain-containing protein
MGICAALALGATGTIAHADVITFQQGGSNALVSNYAGTQDTFLNSSAVDASYGALTVSIAGRDPGKPTADPVVPPSLRTALLRFNLSALAGQYSSINSATLTLFQRETSAQFTDFTVNLYQVSAANGSWVQGTTDTDGTNTAGNPDWAHLSHDTQPWAGSPGLGTPGTDYVTPALSSVTWNSGDAGSTSDKNNTQYSFAIPASLIGDWIGGNNSGLAIENADLQQDGLAQFASAEWTANPGGGLTAPQIRPLLTIDYTPVPEPMGLGLLALGGAALLRRRRMNCA